MYAFTRGERSARFFLIAWTIYISALVMLLLKMLGVFPHNFTTEYGAQIGSALEGLILSIALADRMNIMKREKEAAQEQVILEVKKSESLKSRFLEEAEKLVDARTKELTDIKNELEKLARLDGLTGLPNRRVFDEVYERELSRAKRSGSSFSLIILDVDWFKKYNDHYGHLEGDECLKAIAGCMEKCAKRVTDMLTRYGGEEFAVILTGISNENALEMAHQIRSEVEALAIAHVDSPYKKVTISLGIVSLEHPTKISARDLFNRADHALYEAKNSGRNKVVAVTSSSFS